MNFQKGKQTKHKQLTNSQFKDLPCFISPKSSTQIVNAKFNNNNNKKKKLNVNN